MDGLGSRMVDWTRVGVPEQQRYPTFALTALSGAAWCSMTHRPIWPREGCGGRPRPFGVSVKSCTELVCSPDLGEGMLSG